MRLRAAQQAEIFVADADHIYDSVSVSGTGVDITLMFIADAVTLLEEGVTIVDVEGYRSRPVFRSEFGRNIESIDSAAAQDSINVQANFDFKNSYKVFDVKADITSLIDNTDIRNLRSGVGRTFDYIEAIDSDGETVGIDEIIVGSPPIVTSPVSLRSATLRLIDRSIDPASFVGQFPIRSPQSVGATEKPAIEVRKISDFTKGYVYETFRRATTKAVSGQSRYRRVTSVSRYVPVKVRVTVPITDADENDTLFLVIRANLQNGKMFSRYVFQAPPLRDAIDNPSAKSISKYLQEVKTIANSIQIRGLKSSPQILKGLVRTFRGEPRNDTYYIGITSDLFLKRRIPGTRIERRIGTNQFYGGFAFSSRLILNRSNDVDISLRNSSKQDSDNVRFQISRKLDSLTIKVKKVASDVTESILLRRDITRDEMTFSHISTDASKSRSVDRAPLFVDETCENGHDYEYAIGLIDKFGSLEVSEQKQRYTFLRRQEGVTLKLSDVTSRLERNGGNTTRVVSFRLVPKQIGSRTSSQLAVLKANGIPTASLTDTVNSTTSYSPIFHFEITREDIDTGEIERCGIFTDVEFIDDSAKPGSSLPLTPLKVFGNYKYTVKLGMESAAAMIPTQYSLGISRDGKKYPLNSYKFKKIDRISNSLPSEQELQGATTTLFSLIDTGVESFVNVTGVKQTVSISGVSVTRNSGGFNTVKWNVSGNVEIVDHYRVYAAADGIECLLGCAVRTSGENVFFDSEMFDRVGLVTYRVAPVLLDFSEVASVSDSIFTLRSEPDFIIERSE